MSNAKSIYTCENCGKTVLTENYYGSGRFCCLKCARSFSSRYANTEEKRKQKSETIKNKELVIKHCKKCGCEVYVIPTVSKVLCDKCKQYNFSSNTQFSIDKINKNIISKILELSKTYNSFDMKDIVQVSPKTIRFILKENNIDESKIYIYVLIINPP